MCADCHDVILVESCKTCTNEGVVCYLSVVPGRERRPGQQSSQKCENCRRKRVVCKMAGSGVTAFDSCKSFLVVVGGVEWACRGLG